MSNFIRSTSAFAVALAILLHPATGHAIAKCSAKVSSKDGTITVSGSSVSGAVRWGTSAGTEASAFANEATCVQGGKVKSCQLGAPGSAAAITPPELCRVWVRDDTAECSAYLKGCTPGTRTATAPPLDPRFGSNTSQAVNGRGIECVLGSVWLTAGVVGGATPAAGQLIAISENTSLFQLIGTLYGGDGQNTFALPDLRGAAPNGLTYVICTEGIFPSRL